MSIGENLANLIAVPSRTALDWLRSSCEAVSEQFYFTPVTALEVQKSLEALNSKKATGLDDIQARLLKVAAPAISESLCFLLNFSFTSGKVPSDWKKAKISAIFKKGSKLDPGNYRPIYVLPVISKLLERIVHTQLYTYLNDTGLLAAEQSGFRKNHSTQTSLHKLLENFYSDIENGKIIGMLALDLRKGFDTVNHKILLDKLKHYEISGICLNWFRSYLESRTQMACINGSVSDPLIITMGVQQGSILGPLLFTIYMNDLPKCLQHCKTNMYTDDTAICVSACDKASVTKLMQDDLINVNDWLCANSLRLHIGKTSCMLVTSAQRRRRMSQDHLDLSLNDNQIEHVKASFYLGITIDQNLNFNIQTNNICNKAKRALEP